MKFYVTPKWTKNAHNVLRRQRAQRNRRTAVHKITILLHKGKRNVIISKFGEDYKLVLLLIMHEKEAILTKGSNIKEVINYLNEECHVIPGYL